MLYYKIHFPTDTKATSFFHSRVYINRMGIPGLLQLIEKHCPGKKIQLSDLGGMTIGIDASICIFQWYAIGVSRGIYDPSKTRIINHIRGAYYRTVGMLSQGIRPVYVFDGPAPAAKRARKASIRIPHGVFEEVEQVLAALGVQVVHAPAEAEAQIAHMVKQGIIDAGASEDSDLFAHGCNTIIRGLDLSGKNLKIYHLDDLLQRLQLSRKQWTDLCALCTNDYHGNGLRPHAAYQLIISNKPYSTPPSIREFTHHKVANVKLNPRSHGDKKVLRELLISVGIRL